LTKAYVITCGKIKINIGTDKFIKEYKTTLSYRFGCEVVIEKSQNEFKVKLNGVLVDQAHIYILKIIEERKDEIFGKNIH